MTSAPATITIETAMAITERRSKRTWMRRVEDGTVRRVGPDAGLHTLLVLDDVLPWAAVPMPQELRPMLVQASMGNAEAQAELGQRFCLAGKGELGAHWLAQAARHGSPDAMQWLALLHAGGKGVPKDEGVARYWLSMAAQLGHAIAQAQWRGLEAAQAGEPAGSAA